MKKTRNLAVSFLALMGVLSCGPIPNLRAILADDLTPPTLISLDTDAPNELTLVFLEPATPISGTFSLIPNIPLLNTTCTDNRLKVSFVSDLVPGLEYHLSGVVNDESGNRMKFITYFYGFNPNVPGLLINEFTVRGSSTRPDLVEVYVTSAGNMAGVCIYDGSPANWSDRYIFPALEVLKDDYLLVHFKPQGIEEEVDETGSKTQSGGLNSHPDAWDLWVADGDGLSGNNGVVSVYRSAHSEIIDCVIYSNRTSESDENYRGFGTRNVLERAEEVWENGGWISSDSEISPEDATNPDGSTTTRSICRDSNSTDTDTKSDWHIVPTRGSTFGTENIDDVHEG